MKSGEVISCALRPQPRGAHRLTGRSSRPIPVQLPRDRRFGYRAVEQVTSIYDLHATILHLLGLNHQRLTYGHDGIDRRLTDVHGHVLNEILL